MAKIITFGHEPLELAKKLQKQNVIKVLFDWFNSLDKFTKRMLVSMILLAVITPTAVASYLIFNSHAASTGGIDIAVSSTPSPSITQSSQPTTTVQAVAAGQNMTVDQSIVDMFNLINNYRKSYGLPALKAGYALTNVSGWMAIDMGTYKYMSHYDHLCINLSCAALYSNKCQKQSTCGEFTWARMKRLSYNPSYTYSGENLGYVSVGGASYIFSLWQASAEHRANILGSNYTAIGIAYVKSTDGNWYWATEFGNFYDVFNNVIDTPVTYVSSAPTPTPFCLFNCPTPTPTPKPTSTPTPTPVPTSTSGPCIPGTTRCPNGLTGYQPYGYYQLCNGSRLWSNQACTSGYYCYSNGMAASCVAGCAQRQLMGQNMACITGTSCTTGTKVPYYCVPGTVCCSGVVGGATSTPNPTSNPTSTPPTGGCTNGYKDADGDGYGTGAYGCYTGTVASLAGDCCDSDNRTHPGQTAGFTSPNNCGSYDYNCDGSSTIVGTYYAPSGLTSAVRLNCVGGTCGSCTNGNYTPPFSNSYTTSCGQSGGTNCSYSYFNPGQTTCPASGTASYRAGCTSTTTACN